jgi:hypothetical protein
MVDSYPNFLHTARHKLLDVFQNLIYSFGLTIGLRVISRTEAQLGIHGFMQPFPEF